MVNWLLAEICAFCALFSVFPIVSVAFSTLGNSKGARIFIDDTLGVTATTLNNKGHIKTTTLGVTVDNINNFVSK
jgi:uncharacterized BrkB/YihY/UPF0761 family membrane protein